MLAGQGELERFRRLLASVRPTTAVWERSWHQQEDSLRALPRTLAVQLLTQEAPRPTIPLFDSGKPGLARNSDEAMVGFGSD